MDGFFNCIVSKGDTFLDFVVNAFVCSFWLHFPFWLVVFISFFFSKKIAIFFHRKIIGYSLLIFIPLFLIGNALLAILLDVKPSNYLLGAFIFLMPLSMLGLVQIIISTINLKKYKNEKIEHKFQSFPISNQIILLILIFLFIFGCSMLYSIVNWRFYYFITIIVILLLYGFLLLNKEKNVIEKQIQYKTSDFIPIFIILFIFIGISSFSINDLVCTIPKFSCYFSCANCQ